VTEETQTRVVLSCVVLQWQVHLWQQPVLCFLPQIDDLKLICKAINGNLMRKAEIMPGKRKRI